MKNQKKIRPFFFKDKTHEEMADQINDELPIKLKYNEDLINRIHLKYPVVSKTEISLIVKAVFEGWRELLVLGKVLNFNNLFFDTKLFFFTHKRFGHIFTAVKVKIATPPPLRNHHRMDEKNEEAR